MHVKDSPSLPSFEALAMDVYGQENPRRGATARDFLPGSQTSIRPF